jgi:hypothetical protein
MSEQEKKCINEINNFIKEYKKTIEKDTFLYFFGDYSNYYRQTFKINDSKDDYFYLKNEKIIKLLENCPIYDTKEKKVINYNIVSNVNAKTKYIEYKDYDEYGGIYTNSYYKMDLSPSFFDKILDKIKNIF